MTDAEKITRLRAALEWFVDRHVYRNGSGDYICGLCGEEDVFADGISHAQDCLIIVLKEALK